MIIVGRDTDGREVEIITSVTTPANPGGATVMITVRRGQRKIVTSLVQLTATDREALRGSL